MIEIIYSDTPEEVSIMICKLIDKHYIYRINNNYNTSLTEYFKCNDTDESLINIINTMNKCYCCNRHQHDKPKKLKKYYNTKYYDQDKWYNCKCSCRQLARECCRAKFN